MSSITATHSYGKRVLSSVIIIAQGDTRNMDYVAGSLEKISLEWLLFDQVTFTLLPMFQYCVYVIKSHHKNKE